MNCRAIRAVTWASLLNLCCLAVSAAEPRDLTRRTSERTPALTTPSDLILFTHRIIIDPQTGEVTTVKVPTTSDEPTPATTTDEPAEEEPDVQLPFDYFDTEDQGDSPLNSYLLSQLSMGVYSQAMNEEDFEADLINKFEPQGIDPSNIDAIMEPNWGTEAAAFYVKDATIIAFRGTSGEGTEDEGLDLEVDFMVRPVGVEVDGKPMRVHEGFWKSSEAVYGWVLEHALIADEDGRKLFLTGHSLGGAKATITAMRLHYELGIEVHSLQTFGAPRVGDKDFQLMCNDYGPNDVKLAEVTERFVVNGDPAPMFPSSAAVDKWYGEWVEYVHIGNMHTITPLNDQGTAFDIIFDSGIGDYIPATDATWGFVGGLGNTEHMWYDDALLLEVVNDPSYIDLKDMLLLFEFVVQPDANAD
jgi:hypothetical protein